MAAHRFTEPLEAQNVAMSAGVLAINILQWTAPPPLRRLPLMVQLCCRVQVQRPRQPHDCCAAAAGWQTTVAFSRPSCRPALLETEPGLTPAPASRTSMSTVAAATCHVQRCCAEQYHAQLAAWYVESLLVPQPSASSQSLNGEMKMTNLRRDVCNRSVVLSSLRLCGRRRCRWGAR